MVHSTAVALFALLGMIAGICHLFDLWFSKQEQQAFVERAVSFTRRLTDMNPDELARAPLVGVAIFCSAVLGRGAWSRQALLRIGLLSGFFLLGGLGMTGWILGQPLAVETPPWVTFERTAIAVLDFWPQVEGQSLAQQMSLLEPRQQCEQGEQAREIFEQGRPFRELTQEYIPYLGRWYAKWTYSAFLLISVFTLTSAFNALTFSIARAVVELVLHTQSRTLRATALMVNVLVAAFLSTIAVLVIAIVANPWSWLLVGGAVFLSSLAGPFVASLILAGLFALLSFGAWALSGASIKVVAFTAVVPALMILLAEFLGYLLPYIAPFFSKIILAILERAASHDKGFLAFIATAATALTVILAALVKVFP